MLSVNLTLEMRGDNVNSRKEMIPASALKYNCKPEWELLYRVRTSLKGIIHEKMPARAMRKTLIGLIAHMDDVFDDWPEDPK